MISKEEEVLIDNHNPPKISSGAQEEREGERREKLQCINDPCVPTRRAGSLGGTRPPPGRREGAGTAPRWTAPHSLRRGAAPAGPASEPGETPASGASLRASLHPGAAPLRSPLRSALRSSLRAAGTAAGTAGGRRTRNTRGGQPASLHLLCFIFFFSPLFPSGFPSEVF